MRLPERPRKICAAAIQVTHVRNRVTPRGSPSQSTGADTPPRACSRNTRSKEFLNCGGLRPTIPAVPQSRRLSPSLPNLVVPKPASFGVAPPSRLLGGRPPRLQRRFTLTLNLQLQRASASFLFRASSPRYTRGRCAMGAGNWNGLDFGFCPLRRAGTALWTRRRKQSDGNARSCPIRSFRPSEPT